MMIEALGDGPSNSSTMPPPIDMWAIDKEEYFPNCIYTTVASGTEMFNSHCHFIQGVTIR